MSNAVKNQFIRWASTFTNAFSCRCRFCLYHLCVECVDWAHTEDSHFLEPIKINRENTRTHARTNITYKLDDIKWNRCDGHTDPSTWHITQTARVRLNSGYIPAYTQAHRIDFKPYFCPCFQRRTTGTRLYYRHKIWQQIVYKWKSDKNISSKIMLRACVGFAMWIFVSRM